MSHNKLYIHAIYMHLLNLNFNQFKYLYTCICYAEYGKGTVNINFFQTNSGKSNQRDCHTKIYLIVKIRNLLK